MTCAHPINITYSFLFFFSFVFSNTCRTVKSQELTIGGVLARKAARTRKAWVLKLLGNHPFGGQESLVAYATDEKQTPLFYAFVHGHEICCQIICDYCDKNKKQQLVLDNLVAERDNPVVEMDFGCQSLFGDDGEEDAGGDY